jgi:hypothetical protein
VLLRVDSVNTEGHIFFQYQSRGRGSHNGCGDCGDCGGRGGRGDRGGCCNVDYLLFQHKEAFVSVEFRLPRASISVCMHGVIKLEMRA